MPLAGKTSSFLLNTPLLGGPVKAVAVNYLLDDYPTACLAYSFRKLRSAYAGAAVRIRRSSDSAESDIGFSGQNFDTAAAAAFIGGGSGYVYVFYDQSGNGLDLSEANTSKQPLYSASGMYSLPTADFDGVDDRSTRDIANTTLPLDTTTVMSVMLEDGGHNPCQIFRWARDASDLFSVWTTYDDVLYWDFGNSDSTGRVSAAQPSGWNTGGHLFEIGRDSSDEQFITVNGTELVRTGSKTALPGASTQTFFFGGHTSGPLDGLISELVIWAADLAGNRSAARANVKAYWGTP